MDCCQCQGIEDLFDTKQAARDLRAYRKKGPSGTTQLLIEAIKSADVAGHSILDIGGGVGAIQHELLKAGASSVVSVDASSAYTQVARDEAQRQGHADRVTRLHGNFVDLAPQIEPADVVTLDRVICCYHDVRSLVGLAAQRATSMIGLVYPPDNWIFKRGARFMNLFMRLRQSPFRGFVHPSALVDLVIRGNGLQQRFYRRTLMWQVVVYGR